MLLLYATWVPTWFSHLDGCGLVFYGPESSPSHSYRMFTYEEA